MDRAGLPTRARGRGLALVGPAFIAAIAYVDPGNVATNASAGALYGYTLVWVVVVANIAAMLIQYLSAKLGIVTEQSLAGQLGGRLRTPARICYWLQAEIIAIATNMAEVVGGAIALSILFDLPLVLGALITVAVSLVVLGIGDVRGQHVLERVIMVFLGLIVIGFVAGLFVNPPDPAALAGGLVPRFDGAGSVLLASGIVGATVMPHAIYFHSSLTASRLDRRGLGLSVPRLLRATKIDVVAALILAGLVNLTLLVVAATSLHGVEGTDTLDGVYSAITSELGSTAALLFALALLSSGLASTSVGSAAGAEVMQSLLLRTVPVNLRRLLTALPAVIVLMLGAEPGLALVLSQVVLSIGIPFALIPLVALTSRSSVMGRYANRRSVTVAAGAVAAAVTVLNGVLLWIGFTS